MLNLDIAFLDGTRLEVLAVAPEFIKWEAKFDLSVARFSQDMKLTHLMFLGWSALTRTKQTELEFDDWVDLVQEVKVIDSKKLKG